MPGSSPGMTRVFRRSRSRRGCALFFRFNSQTTTTISLQHRHCEPSGAHSRDPLARNDGALIPDTRSRPRGAARPSRAFIARPMEGVGNAGCPLHPRPRVHFVLVESTRVTTSTPESPGIPARNGFNSLCRALPGDLALLPPSPRGYHARPHPLGPTCHPQNLTPASGRQDHTIVPAAATSLVIVPVLAHEFLRTRPAIPSRAKRCRVHRIPPRVRDDRDTPLWWGGMARTCRDDLPDG